MVHRPFPVTPQSNIVDAWPNPAYASFISMPNCAISPVILAALSKPLPPLPLSLAVKCSANLVSLKTN
jgi:hypothetical protein